MSADGGHSFEKKYGLAHRKQILIDLLYHTIDQDQHAYLFKGMGMDGGCIFFNGCVGIF